MATVDLTAGDGKQPLQGAKLPFYVKQQTVDFKAAPRSASDVLQLIEVPANTLVLAVFAEVEVAEGGTLTFDIGDGADPDGYLDNVNGNAVGVSASLATTAYSVAVGGGRLYSAADTIDMVLDNNAGAGKITVRALLCDFNPL